MDIRETCKKQWQTVCATQSPSEIMAQLIVIGIIGGFLIVLAFMQPHLMGLAVVAVVGTGGLALLIREAHEKVLTWLNAQCDAAKIQAMRDEDNS